MSPTPKAGSELTCPLPSLSVPSSNSQFFLLTHSPSPSFRKAILASSSGFVQKPPHWLSPWLSQGPLSSNSSALFLGLLTPTEPVNYPYPLAQASKAGFQSLLTASTWTGVQRHSLLQGHTQRTRGVGRRGLNPSRLGNERGPEPQLWTLIPSCASTTKARLSGPRDEDSN